jgi:hypothetical protein
MFKAYYYRGGVISASNTYIVSSKHYNYIYRIVDTDFDEEWVGPCTQTLWHHTVRCGAIISCYEHKKLNVAFNLALYHRWMVENFEWYKLEDEFRFNSEHTPLYEEYLPVVKQYLDRFNNLKVFW